MTFSTFEAELVGFCGGLLAAWFGLHTLVARRLVALYRRLKG